MRIYPVTQARDELATLIDAVLAGETVIIERNRAPVAKIAPLSTRDLSEWRRHKAASPRADKEDR